jgi:hypothetical protein
VSQLVHVLGQVAEEEDVVLANLARDFDLVRLAIGTGGKRKKVKLTFAPSHVPIISPPFSTNFMLLVPDASVPAVEMCSLMSEAGQMISALLTL